MVDADTDEETENTEALEAELELAAAGDWEALGLDPPPDDAPVAPPVEEQTFTPATISDFLNA